MFAVAISQHHADAQHETARTNVSLVVVVELRDFANLGDDTCRLIKKEVDRIFDETGIRFAWTDPTERGREAVDVTRVYVTRQLPKQLIRRRQSLLGVAIPSTARYRYIYVGKSEVEHTLGTSPVPRRFFSRALGRVIAHELAHHLVDTAEHSKSGLLKASMTARDLTEKEPADLYLDDAQIARARASARRSNRTLNAKGRHE